MAAHFLISLARCKCPLTKTIHLLRYTLPKSFFNISVTVEMFHVEWVRHRWHRVWRGHWFWLVHRDQVSWVQAIGINFGETTSKQVFRAKWKNSVYSRSRCVCKDRSCRAAKSFFESILVIRIHILDWNWSFI